MPPSSSVSCCGRILTFQRSIFNLPQNFEASCNNDLGALLTHKLKITLVCNVMVVRSFMEPEGSLPCLKQSATGQYHERDKYNHTFPPYFHKFYCIIILAHMPRSLEWSLPFRSSDLNFIWVSHLSYLILLDLTVPIIFEMWDKKYKVEKPFSDLVILRERDFECFDAVRLINTSLYLLIAVQIYVYIRGETMKFPEWFHCATLKGAMRLGGSKDYSVQVSTCTTYDFKLLTPLVWKLWRWWDGVCFYVPPQKLVISF